VALQRFAVDDRWSGEPDLPWLASGEKANLCRVRVALVFTALYFRLRTGHWDRMSQSRSWLKECGGKLSDARAALSGQVSMAARSVKNPAMRR